MLVTGAGKSTFAPSFLPIGLSSFDYDRVFQEVYNSMPDSELREVFARDSAAKKFETAIAEAQETGSDFCYETNFDTYPIYWVEEFKKKGYNLNLIFFCLENQEIAKHRIQVRTEFWGHFVDDKTIETKWKAGYQNVNKHFELFDNILFVDNSKQNEIYTNILQIENGEFVLMSESIPEYFSHRLPDIYDLFLKA
ncbi:MAG: zeta toxin family protein [Bacteroidota bacterium]|nr:zeta toxin family protein [Bacteroidota bacterium]